MLEPPRWVGDGSGFLFVGLHEMTVNGTTRTSRGLFAFDLATRKVTPVVVPDVPDTRVADGAISPDGAAIVYCLQVGDAQKPPPDRSDEDPRHRHATHDRR